MGFLREGVKCILDEVGDVVSATPEGMGCHTYFEKCKNDT